MKINPLNLHGNCYTTNFNSNAKQQTSELPNNTTLTSNVTLGRSLVNFKQREFVPVKEDKTFLKNVAEALHLNEESKKKLSEIFVDFMQENNIKSLDDIGDDSQIDDQLSLIYKITNNFHLDNTEETIVISEVSARTIKKELYEYNPKIKYEKDITSLIQICQNYDMHEDDISYLFEYLKTKALVNDYDSIFDIFRNNNYEKVEKHIKGLSKSNKEDLILDLNLFAFNGIKMEQEQSSTADKFNIYLKKYQNKNICTEICEAFNLSPKDKNFVLDCLEKRELPQENSTPTGKNNFEIAYTIAEKFNLNPDAEKTILSILSAADKTSYKELRFSAMYDLINDDI